jgi:hypothetical protein
MRVSVLAMIGSVVRLLAPRVPYAMSYAVSIDGSTGTLRLRLFGSITAEQQAALERAAGEVYRSLYVEVSREATRFDLEALANDVLDKREGAAEVLVDALLELGMLNNKHCQVAPGDVAEGRARLGRLATMWANEVFGDSGLEHDCHALADSDGPFMFMTGTYTRWNIVDQFANHDGPVIVRSYQYDSEQQARAWVARENEALGSERYLVQQETFG